MKKKLVMLLCAAMITGTLSACGIEGNIVINQDGTITQSANLYYNEKEYDQLIAGTSAASACQKVEKNGKTFYLDLTNGGNTTTRCLSTTEIYAPLSAGANKDSTMTGDVKDVFDFYVETITFLEPVVKTNGKLSEDQKTVTFDLVEMIGNGEKALYAYTAASKGALYLDADKFIKDAAESVDIVSDSKIVSVKVNGKEVVPDTKVSIKKDGKYNITVDNESISKTFTVIKDTLAPVIKGVKNGKTYKKPVTIKFSDANKIVSATLNNKKIKSGTKIKKKGTYTLEIKDEAGNTNTVEFRIK